MRENNRLYNFYNTLMVTHITHFPDWRFGQFCDNLFTWIRGEYKVDPFFVEDDKMEEYIKNFVSHVYGKGTL